LFYDIVQEFVAMTQNKGH